MMHPKIKDPSRASNPYRLQRPGMPTVGYRLELADAVLTRSGGFTLDGTATVVVERERISAEFILKGISGIAEFKEKLEKFDWAVEPCTITGLDQQGAGVQAKCVMNGLAFNWDTLGSEVAVWCEEVLIAGGGAGTRWDRESFWAMVPVADDLPLLMEHSSYMKNHRGCVTPDHFALTVAGREVVVWVPLSDAWRGRPRRHPGLLLQVSPHPPHKDIESFRRTIKAVLGVPLHMAAPPYMEWHGDGSVIWRQPARDFLPSRSPLALLGSEHVQRAVDLIVHFAAGLPAKQRARFEITVQKWASALTIGVPEEASLYYCTTIENLAKIWSSGSGYDRSQLIPTAAFRRWRVSGDSPTPLTNTRSQPRRSITDRSGACPNSSFQRRGISASTSFAG